MDTIRENPEHEDFEPDDGYHTPIRACAELLRAGIEHGVEAIKAILQPWTTERRWCAVLVLEKIAVNELRWLEQLSPRLYEWLNESNLPRSGATG